MDGDCEYGKANRILIENYKEVFEGWRTNDFMHFKVFMETKLEDLNRKLVGRPSWAVLVIITVLSSLCVGLLVKVLSTSPMIGV